MYNMHQTVFIVSEATFHTNRHFFVKGCRKLSWTAVSPTGVRLTPLQNYLDSFNFQNFQSIFLKYCRPPWPTIECV